MKQINKFFAGVGIVFLALVSILIDVVALCAGIVVLGSLALLIVPIFIVVLTYGLTVKALKGL